MGTLNDGYYNESDQSVNPGFIHNDKPVVDSSI
jgi:hypothetical protein